MTDATPYNFLRPHRISKDRRSTLATIYHRYAVSMQALLSSRLRLPADVTIKSVEQATFGEFLLSRATPCAAFVFDLGDGSGFQGVLDLSIELSYQLVDRMFGGPGGARTMPRPLTPLEHLVVKGIVDRSLGFFSEAWQEHHAFQPIQAGFESMPDALQVANHEDTVLVTTLEARAGDFTGEFAICLPLVALESFLQEKRVGAMQAVRVSDAERATQRNNVEQALRLAALPVSVRFPRCSMRARDVAALSVGQVIHLGYPIDAPLEIHVNGRRRFWGVPGQVRRALGIRITQVCPAGQAEPNGRIARVRVL